MELKDAILQSFLDDIGADPFTVDEIVLVPFLCNLSPDDIERFVMVVRKKNPWLASSIVASCISTSPRLLSDPERYAHAMIRDATVGLPQDFISLIPVQVGNRNPNRRLHERIVRSLG